MIPCRSGDEMLDMRIGPWPDEARPSGVSNFPGPVTRKLRSRMVDEVHSARSLLVVEITDRVAVITLNRPEARNALNRELLEGLSNSLTDMDARTDVDVTVLTGADPVFYAGLDLGEFAPGGSLDLAELTRAGSPWPPRT